MVANADDAGLGAAFLLHEHKISAAAFARAIPADTVKTLVELLDGTGQNNKQKVANDAAIAGLVVLSDLTKFPERVDTAKFKLFIGHAAAKDLDFNKMPSAVLKEHAVLIVAQLSAAKRLQYVDYEKLRAMLEVDKAAAEIKSEDAFAEMVKASQKHAEIFNGTVFSKIDPAVWKDAKLGSAVRRLPADVFENVNDVLNDDFLRYATADQLGSLQSSAIPDEDTALLPATKTAIQNPLKISPHLASAIHDRVWLAYFEKKKGSKPVKSDWRFWKRIPVQAIGKAAEKIGVPKFIFLEDLLNLTLEQRQAILNSGDLDSTLTYCKDIDSNIFKGKLKRKQGLTVSKSCIESAHDASVSEQKQADFFWSAMAINAVDAGEMTDVWDDKFITKFQSKVEKKPQTNKATGKVTNKGEKDTFDGILAFEKSKAAAEVYVDAFFGLTDREELIKAVCKEIKLEQLKKAPWMQAKLSTDCVGALPSISLNDLKTLDANIAAKLSESQIEGFKLATSKATLSKPDFAPALAGLQQNKEFVKAMLVREEDATKGFKPAALTFFLPETRSKHLGADFVINSPTDKDSQAALAEHIGSLGEGALSKSSNTDLRAVADLVKNATDAQFGHASDDVDDTASYPAHMTTAEVHALSDARVSALGAKFVSRLNDTALGAFSDGQVKALAPEALTLLSPAKAKLLHGELSAEQKEALGKARTDAVAAKPDAGGAAPAYTALAGLAAAAAGSLALLL